MISHKIRLDVGSALLVRFVTLHRCEMRNSAAELLRATNIKYFAGIVGENIDARTVWVLRQQHLARKALRANELRQLLQSCNLLFSRIAVCFHESERPPAAFLFLFGGFIAVFERDEVVGGAVHGRLASTGFADFMVDG